MRRLGRRHEPRDDHARPRPRAPAAADARGSPARTGVKLVRIGRFDQPLYVTAPPGDKRRLFVVEQTGRIRLLKRGKLKSRPFLDLSGAGLVLR